MPFLIPGVIVQQSPVQVPSLQSLSQALPSLAWSVASRGPLLAIGAEQVPLPRLMERMQEQKQAPVPPPNTPAKTVAELFEYRVEKVGTLHILIPQKIKRFVGAPDIDPTSVLPLERYELAQELGYSLTKEQWGMLSSPQGLGYSDLTPKQQALFLAVLPEPIRIQPTQPSNPNEPSAVTLTPEQRAQIRLHMNRRLTLSFMAQDSNFGSVSFGDGPGQPKRNFYLSYDGERKEPLYERIAPEVPNKLKPGELDFASPKLDAHVAFEGVKTVAELMQRVRAATGLSIILSDARYGSLTVKSWGESARSGDVLKALCLRFGGAVRKVGEGDSALYVLTDDRIGLGTRLAAFQEWRSDASSGRWRDQEKRNKALESVDFSRMTPLDDPFGFSPEGLSQIEKRRFQPWDPSKTDARGMSLSSLPPTLQTYVNKTLDERPSFKFYGQNGEQETSLRRDRVEVNANYQLEMEIPGWGRTDAHELWALTNIPSSVESSRYFRENPPRPEPPKPLRYPPDWKVRALLIRPKDATRSRELASKARESGFNVLWVEVPLDVAVARPLIAAAQEAKLPVVALASVLQVPRRSIPPGAQSDLSILGETSEQAAERQRLRMQRQLPDQVLPLPAEPLIYLSPTPQTQKLVIERTEALAKLPGLAALALKGITPPGYESQGTNAFSGMPGLGYTLENRLAFLQKESIDPIDLSEYGDPRLVPALFANSSAPYIQLPSGQYGPDPNWRDLKRVWRELLEGRIKELKKTLHARLKAGAPSLPVWISPDESLGFGGYYSLWEKPDAKVSGGPNPWEPKAQLARARSFSSQSLTLFNLSWESLQYAKKENERKAMFESWRSYLVNLTKVSVGGKTWQGVLIDIGECPPEKLAELLAVCKEDAP